MERLFLCCFRSCLKGPNDHDYYDALEISDRSRCTTELVKKQYKKLSLTLHPDKLAQKGIEVTNEHKAQFHKLKEAYDVLSDPKKRRLYDEYGPLGLKLIENPTEISHTELLKNFQRNRGDRTTLALGIAMLFACILLLPILFSLKCDGTLGDDAPWVAIWSPMWFVDFVLLFLSVYLFVVDDDDEERDEDGNKIEKSEKEKVPLVEKIANFITTSLFVLLQIFITMRMDGYIEWSWFAVFAPWFFYELNDAIVHLPVAFTSISPPDHSQIEQIDVEEGQNPEEELFMAKLQKEAEYFEKVMEKQRSQKTIFISALRVWLAIFLALKLNGSRDWNWGLVLLPVWVYLFTQVVHAFILRLWGSSKLEGLDPEIIMAGAETDPIKLSRFQQGNDLKSNGFLTCVTMLVPLFISVMLVCRLQVDTYSTFLIILPVFLGVGCCCCVVFCGLCCLTVVNTEDFENEANGNSDQPQGSGEEQYAPPEMGVVTPTPPEPAESTPNPAYGTFTPASEEPTNITSESTEVPPSEKSHLLPSTTIDADID